jgi:hypothetical protein
MGEEEKSLSVKILPIISEHNRRSKHFEACKQEMRYLILNINNMYIWISARITSIYGRTRASN